jgi:hypothetical protein
LSVDEAVTTLAGAVKTAKGRAALDVLKTELQAGGSAASKKAAPPSRGGFGGAKGIVRQMQANRAGSARGGGTA